MTAPLSDARADAMLKDIADVPDDWACVFNAGEIRALLAARLALAGVTADAERYRWLFEDNGNGVMDRVNRVWRQWNGLFKDWDAAIDAAIKESEKGDK